MSDRPTPKELTPCPICGEDWNWKDPCVTCTENFEKRKPADQMDPEERVEEMKVLYGPITIEFKKVHQRFEELCGRPVWTHELVNRERMYEAARHWLGNLTKEELLEYSESALGPNRTIIVEVPGEEE